MYLIILSLASIFLCYKLGDWRNWRKYYSTIIFFILGSVVCIVLTYDHPLWLYKSTVINHTFTDLFISITIYPSTIMTFIPHFPKGIKKILMHISFYVVIYTIPEYIAVKLGCFAYYNGWSIWHTFVFNYIMFPVLILHYEKPLYAWIIALVSPHILFYILNIPYSSIR